MRATHRPRFTILFSHGNAEDIGQLNDWLCYMSRTFSVCFLPYAHDTIPHTRTHTHTHTHAHTHTHNA
jgi:hypothetical protein